MRRLIMGLSLLALVGCTQPIAARQTLEAEGYTNIQLTGYNFFACDKNDTFHDGFTARTAAGHQVTGVVCAGIFKGQTIRITHVD